MTLCAQVNKFQWNPSFWNQTGMGVQGDRALGTLLHTIPQVIQFSRNTPVAMCIISHIQAFVNHVLQYGFICKYFFHFLPRPATETQDLRRKRYDKKPSETEPINTYLLHPNILTARIFSLP